MKRQLSAPRIPKENGIVDRINKSIIEAARVMLANNDVSKIFCREVVNTIVYTMNRMQVRKDTKKTHYELLFGQ